MPHNSVHYQQPELTPGLFYFIDEGVSRGRSFTALTAQKVCGTLLSS